MRRQVTRIKLDNIPQVIELKVRLKQNTLFILKISLSLRAEKPSLLSRGLDITVNTGVGSVSDHVVRRQLKLDIAGPRGAGLTDSG